MRSKIQKIAAVIACCLVSIAMGTMGGCEIKDEDPPIAPVTGKSCENPVPNEYIVVMRDDVRAEMTDLAVKQVQGLNGEIHYRYEHAFPGFSAHMSPTAVEALQYNTNVRFIEQACEGHVTGIQMCPPSWGLDRISQRDMPLDGVYNFDGTGKDIDVYVVDSGIRSNHDALKDSNGVSRVKAGIDAYCAGDPNLNPPINTWVDAINQCSDAEDCQGHGTNLAGIVGGEEVGVARETSLIPVRVTYTSPGVCLLDTDSTTLNKALDLIIDHHQANERAIALIGASIHFIPDPNNPPTLATSVKALADDGVVVVTSAGNNEDDACGYLPGGKFDKGWGYGAQNPAITVGATADANVVLSDQVWIKSNTGECVDIYAPGEGILSSDVDGCGQGNPPPPCGKLNKRWAGTSQAAAHVAGVAALLWQKHPDLTGAEVAGAVLGLGSDAVTEPGGSLKRLLFSPSAAMGSPGPGAPASVGVNQCLVGVAPCFGSSCTLCSAMQACCDLSCGHGILCDGGACGTCGGKDEACCLKTPNGNTPTCATSLTCEQGVCRCGAPGQPCCGGMNGTCDGDLQCNSGTCGACGGVNQACCGGKGGTCDAPLKCDANGKCGNCGGVGQVCCGGMGGTCDANLQCDASGKCAKCGGAGQPCCGGVGGTCDAPLECGGAGQCGNCGGVGQGCCGGPGGTCDAPLECNANGTCGNCGGLGESCCGGASGTCKGALECKSGICGDCGTAGLACCAGQCFGDDLTCTGGTCQICGIAGMACCAGHCLGDDLTCSGGMCEACGVAGTACCAGKCFGDDLTCSGGMCEACGSKGAACCGGQCFGVGLMCAEGKCTDCKPGTTTCGVGACATTVQNCVNGQAQQCQPGAPSAETCNGIDDDCDGKIDNSVPLCGLSYACKPFTFTTAAGSKVIPIVQPSGSSWVPFVEVRSWSISSEHDGSWSITYNNGAFTVATQDGSSNETLSGNVCLLGVGDTVNADSVASSNVHTGQNDIMVAAPPANSYEVASLSLGSITKYECASDDDFEFTGILGDKTFSLSGYDPSDPNGGSYVAGHLASFSLPSGYKVKQKYFTVYNDESKNVQLDPDDPDLGVNLVLVSILTYNACNADFFSYNSDCSASSCVVSAFNGNSCSYVDGVVTQIQWVDNQ